ncbi:MAG: rRNA adenine N-6-methyltransferase family protein [Candidatus Rehaiarchaeum fermentans]|nr:hypothetical protein [Candidatus Rehaiarchaeum fermentans]
MKLEAAKIVSDRLNLKFEERRGINFLLNEDILKKEIELLNLRKNDIVLEIGPGLGESIDLLKEKSFKYYVGIELDKKLYNYLEKKENENVVIIRGDASKIRLPYFDKLLSNLPFYAVDKIMFNLVKYEGWEGVFIIPLSFANKLAEKNSNKMLYLSYFLKIIHIEKLDPKDFYPIPKTQIVLVKIKRESNEITKILRENKVKIKNIIKKYKVSNYTGIIDLLEKRIGDLDREELSKFISFCESNFY